MFTKRTSSLLLGACCWLLASGLPSSGQAAAAGSSGGQIDVNFFYDQLKNDGSWFNTTQFGDVWQPYIAYKSESWRPYTDGYWTYTDGGWMFVSYEDFGWAVYHYGRWTQLKDIGWAWVPGTDWSPAWVTWRESSPDGATENGQPAANVAATTTDTADQGTTPPPPPTPVDNGGGAPPPQAVSNNYVGWAPLPPDPEPVVAGGYYSYGPTVDVDFGIDPYDYSFVDARYFGAPFLGGVIFGGDRGYYYAEHSVNITNVYYNRNGAYRGFYNGGPRYERFNGVSERPIPRANIQRVGGRAAQEAIRSGRVSQINGKNASVYAPNFSQKNVHNGRVTFANRGAVPVSQIGRERPANAANDAARERAANAFHQQGEAYRTKNPGAPGIRNAGQPSGAGGKPEITTTPQAQAQERTDRQEQHQGNETAAKADNHPTAAKANRETAAEHQPTRSSRSTGRHSGASRSSRSSGGHQAVERAPRASGGGGGHSQGGGGGGHASGGGGHGGGGGGGHPKASGGGGGHGGGGGGGGKKK